MDLVPFFIQKTEVTFSMSLLVTNDTLCNLLLHTEGSSPTALSPSHSLWHEQQPWLQLAWLYYFITSKLLLPRLPCSSLCFCPLNFAHCWQSPVLGLRISGAGACWQGCRGPVPDQTPYLFTCPEEPTCTMAHSLALPSSVLNKKGKNSV